MRKRTKETKELHDKNFKKYGLDMNVFVSLTTAVLVLLFVGFVLLFPDYATTAINDIKQKVMTSYNWLFVLVINLTLVFLLFLGISKYGKTRIGGEYQKKEFSNFSWYAMLFSAGIGIGIFFWGIAEPIYHLSLPEPLQSGSVYDPFKIMYLHWGIHAWAVYGLVAIVLGYFTYNKGLPMSIRSVFYPILGDKIFGIIGDIIDTVSVLAVLFGLSTSLGLGAMQVNAGFNYIFGTPISPIIQLVIIVVITIFATMSVVSGLSKGIKILSEINIRLSSLLLLVILVIGPTGYILKTFVGSVTVYFKDFVNMGLYTASSADSISWQGAWTIFYWAWWISWSPFVGIFIAKISKGRTIRELVFGVIVLPSFIIFFAMTVLGATGFYLNETMNGVIVNAVNDNLATSLFVVIENVVSSDIVSMILALISLIAIVLFFVTSSDSGSLVVDSLTSGGRDHTPKGQRIFWAAMEGLIAAAVLLLGGAQGLNALQTVVIIVGLPFSLIFILMIYSLIVELRRENKKSSQ